MTHTDSRAPLAMRKRALWKYVRTLPALLGCVGLTGCQGWQKPEPDEKHLAEINTLFKDRYSDALDTLKLIKTNPRESVAGVSGTLTSDQAVQLALTHNLSLVAASESLPIAQANLVQAGLLPNPTFAQTGAFYFPLFGGHAAATAFDIFLSESINEFWTTPHKVAVAKAQRFQAGIDLSTQAFNLAQQTQQQYQQLAYLSRDGALQRRIAGTYKQAVDEATAMLKAGMVTRSDFNRAVIAYEDNLRQAHHYDTQYLGAARQMNWLMGVQSAVEWKLPSSIQGPPNVLTELPNQERLEDLAVKYRLDLLRADFDRKIAEVSVKLAQLGYIPNITLGFDANRDNTKNWTGGPAFSTSIPLFDPGIVAVWTAKYQQEQTERTYVTLTGQCRQDVRNALNALQVAAEDVIFSRDITIPQEEENIKQALLSFQKGNSQFDDYLNAVREYVGVLQGYEDEIQAYNQAVIGLETAVGLSFRRIVDLSAGAPQKSATGADVPKIKINPLGGAKLPETLPGNWQVPHRPFRLDDATQPATTQPATTQPATTQGSGALWPYEIVPGHKPFRIWDETQPSTRPAPPATSPGGTEALPVPPKPPESK